MSTPTIFFRFLARKVIIGASLVLSNACLAQSVLNKSVSGTFYELSIVEFFQILENRYDVHFYYEPSKIPYYQQSFEFQETPLFATLERFLEGSNLDVIKYGDNIVIGHKLTVTRQYVAELIDKWESGIYQKPVSKEAQHFHLIFGDSLTTHNAKVRLSGFIRDKYSKVPIIGAVVKDMVSGLGTTTDDKGYYEMERVPERYRFSVSYLGYQPLEIKLELFESASADFEMQVHALNLSEVIVEASASQNKIDEIQIGVETISMKAIRELPSFLGESDIMKSLEKLPGVSTAGEASSGFNVRGGNIDQNLVLLDDAPLFNASHVLGFFSIFNTDAIRNVSLYKGNIPAQYGGRLSSVLQVESKDGNPKRWQGKGGIGLASARFVLDGPISSKSGLVLGLRTSYSNWLLRLAESAALKDSEISFGDAIGKLSHRLSDKHSISASIYLSQDYFLYANEFGYRWSSRLGNLKWRYLISNQLSLSTSLIRGAYRSNQFVLDGGNAFDLSNGIKYWKAKSNLSFQNDIHYLNVGFEGLKLEMDPEKIKPYDQYSGIEPKTISHDQGIELGIYVNDELRISPHLSLSVGLRFSQYVALGPSEIRIYDPELPFSPTSVMQTRSIGRNEKVSSFQGLEPRVSVNWKLNEDRSLKISYNRMKQYIHLLSGTVSATPVDIWQLSNIYLEPQTANNYSIGYFQRIGDSWDVSMEGFYKSVQDLLQFKDHAALLINDHLETEIISGPGRSFGTELHIAHNFGRWTGNIAYTFSRSQVRTEGVFAEDIINGNQWYYSNFDQPHQFNLQLKFSPNKVRHLQLAFTYKTGRPITGPDANYEIQGVLVTHYSQRNSFRVPAYHRLDIGYTSDKRQAKLKGLRNSFTVSFYNLYARRNAYSIYFRRDSQNIQRAYKLSILGSVFPSLTWNFTF